MLILLAPEKVNRGIPGRFIQYYCYSAVYNANAAGHLDQPHSRVFHNTNLTNLTS